MKHFSCQFFRASHIFLTILQPSNYLLRVILSTTIVVEEENQDVIKMKDNYSDKDK